MKRLLSALPPWRWWRSLRALAGRARVHPQAHLLGHAKQIRLAAGCALAARVRIDPGSQGTVQIGERVWIAADVEIQTDTRLQVGAGSTIQRRSSINGSTRLGRGCILAPGVFISSGTHPFRSIPYLPIREQERRLAEDAAAMAALDRPVWVQDDCWLGVNAVVCAGVTVGKGSVVGANAVVTRDVPPYSVVAGSPARVIGTRLKWQPRAQLDPKREEDHPYLLDAHICSGADGDFIELAHDASLLAALQAGPRMLGLAITYHAVEAVSVVAKGVTFSLARGHGVLHLDVDRLKLEGEVVYCELALVFTAGSRACLAVLNLSRVDDA